MKEIVIKISDDIFNQISKGRYAEFSRTVVGEAIKNGTVLPEGHGRLIDADNIVYDRECVWESDGCCTTKSIPNIAETPTMVEADKEEE